MSSDRVEATFTQLVYAAPVSGAMSATCGDAGEMQGRCRGDAGEMQGRCRGDAREMQGRCMVRGEVWATIATTASVCEKT